MKAEYISHMGDDLTVVNAARVSFDKESADISLGDKKLIKYLACHGHWTPFSHPQITMRYTVPIFVARQEFKHIVGFARNEESRRYISSEPKFFTPSQFRKRPLSSIKQGSGDNMHPSGNKYWQRAFQAVHTVCMEAYTTAVEGGMCPEQARMILPQSMYTSYYVTGSLASFARMVKQRSDPQAQGEIQELAGMVDKIIRPLYPASWAALVE